MGLDEYIEIVRRYDKMEWYKVRVFFINSEIHEDEIKGDSPEHALERAYWNWDQAEQIELI